MKRLALLLIVILLLGCCAGCTETPDGGQDVLGVDEEEVQPSESTPIPGEFDEYIGTDYLCKDGNHQFVSEVMADTTCVDDGQILHICTLCGEGYVETVHATGHYVDPASCDLPATCIDCGATLDPALGHSVVNGTCTRCGEKVE